MPKQPSRLGGYVSRLRAPDAAHLEQLINDLIVDDCPLSINDEGWWAGWRTLPLDDCPYGRGTDEASEWIDGWAEGVRDAEISMGAESEENEHGTY